MSAALMAALAGTMVATAFLAGIFGMAGGMILMGVLLALLPVPQAMALHAVTQMASNGWRGLLWWRYVRWIPVAYFLAGCLVALLVWSLWRYVPSKPVAFILLGVTPFLARVMPKNYQPDPFRFSHGMFYGVVCASLMLLTGVSGPLLDQFFLGGGMERRQIVATKAVCQVFSHAAKLIYFGGLVAGADGINPLMAALAIAASMLGTSLARPVLERLTDHQYRRWAGHIITAIAVIYLAQGFWLLMRGAA